MTKLVFGFGSLINASSLHKTAPHASATRPAYVKGFRRDFSVWAKSGSIHLVPANTPFCALDIQTCDDSELLVNGVCFTVDKHDFKRLMERECEYEPVETTAYDFETGEELGTCVLFSACKNNGEYESGAPAQTGYLKTCVEGAKGFGSKFYEEFLETTYIGNQRLTDLPELIKELT
jgi:cation transport regulator ChaC